MNNGLLNGSPHDCLIVGAGPAGLSAAMVLGRARRRVVLCDDGRPRNAAAIEMHGFITRDYTPPHELLAIGRTQLARYPSIDIVEDTVEDLRMQDGVAYAKTPQRSLAARTVILATGMIDDLPAIENLDAFWGHSVFTCPYCDGWEVRDRRIAIEGTPSNLVGLAQELYQWSSRLTILSYDESNYDDRERAWMEKTGVATHAHAAAALQGADGTLERIALANGETVDCEAMFVCAPLVQRSHLIRKLGCNVTHHGRVIVDEEQRTSVPGVYAAGDASAHVHQVIVAAAGGAKAAIAANNDLVKDDVRVMLSVPNGAGAMNAGTV